jgi:hypothetical protein
MDATSTELTGIIVMQILTVVVVVLRTRGGRTGGEAPKTHESRRERREREKEEERKHKEEGKTDEVKRLKGILADPTRLDDYATMKFKGDAEKAAKDLEKRLKELTGEVFEAPF